MSRIFGGNVEGLVERKKDKNVLGDRVSFLLSLDLTVLLGLP